MDVPKFILLNFFSAKKISRFTAVPAILFEKGRRGREREKERETGRKREREIEREKEKWKDKERER